MPNLNRAHCGRYESMLSRRRWLQRAGGGLGGLALGQLLSNSLAHGSEEQGGSRVALDTDRLNPLSPRAAHFPAKVKSIIWLFMEGAPSSVDMFDPKPELTKRDGQRISIDVFNGSPGPLMKSPFSFKQYGESGAWVCDRYANVAKHVDDFAFIKSLHSDSNDHVPALYQINTGIARPGFPAAGAWVTYGLGSENQNLPGFVVLGNNQGIKGGPLNWHAGFLPAAHQGTLFRAEGSPILNLVRPAKVEPSDQRNQLDLLGQLNELHREMHPDESELLGRIQSFELAYRMQAEAASQIDFTQETQQTRDMYGLDQKETNSYGSKCLLARRLVESGVRFVQVYSDGEWDAHSDLAGNHTGHCRATDIPIDGLLTDLKQRGLMESTLVIWGGEFGRMPVSQGDGGRDHNPQGFMAWMAGAGIKGGTSFGETDEIGYKAVVDPVTVHDLHATMLHLLGMDHKRLTYFHNGREYRLTDVAGEVLTPLLS